LIPNICYSTAVSVVVQKAVKRHLVLLQGELDDLKAKLNAQNDADLLTHTESRKLELLLFNIAWTKVADVHLHMLEYLVRQRVHTFAESYMLMLN